MNTTSTLRPRTGDALIIVDVQNDFLPGGALALPQGNEVVSSLNRFAASWKDRAYGARRRFRPTLTWRKSGRRQWRMICVP